MRRSLRAMGRLASAAVHMVRGLYIVYVDFRRLDAEGRRRSVQAWNAGMLRCVGMAIETEGALHPGAKLVIANHVSWLDILAINALTPMRFVSKAEVHRWPVVGRLATAGGTLYIERERSRDALRVVHHMAEALQAGDTVAVFPEGTTGEGHTLLPFHANLFQAAIVTRSPVQPLALRYRDARHAVSPAVAYVGDTSLLTSLWRVVFAEGLTVRVQVLPAHEVTHADRRALARYMRECVASALGVASDPG